MFRGCPHCEKPSAIEVRYDYSRLRVRRNRNATGLHQWRELLPAFDNPVSLYEGNTPLVPYPVPGSPVRLLIKNETQNPTWSWKDRANAMSSSAARQFGYKNLVVVSTGNHGNAAAAYSSAAGLRCRVLCNSDVPAVQVQLMRHYGAETIIGDNQEQLLCELLAGGDWFPGIVICPRIGYANPFSVEGFKTIAFEIVEQLNGTVPDRIFVPTGSGDGLYGVAKGFRELVLSGEIERSPRIVCCQARQVNPFVQAFREGRRHLTRVAGCPTLAASIAEEIGDQVALQAIYDSGGEARDASEVEIRHAVHQLAHHGLALEPASAVGLACALAHPEVKSEETWVVIGTGTAIRWPESYQ
ncbi:MAG: pyridoxal-phosphate dependent enzyme [Bryobacteraceae bacterium]|nr:pyridoxal-phosphate dependent enzyme [Bryobacteraceae bacterium]